MDFQRRQDGRLEPKQNLVVFQELGIEQPENSSSKR
jgi:hypothetical protein